ncbi:HoxN/HupN/NixA family nickel/cobalt transporter [Tautonia rosea]|uniref:HoxN/HupN/NixA family nickel/cobalt transporter n=1 Tax=Tautonia rosea TaxID=2728037 RepID=UPI001472C531|nr:hypothetical protein [Tautonia rosea]
MPTVTFSWFWVAIVLVISIVAQEPAQAHDIPNERVDRAIQIILDPPSLQVVYEVSQTEWTLYQDLKRLAPERAGDDRIDRIEGYARMIAPLNARGLLATVDQTELSWTIDDVAVNFEEHLLLRFVFQASIPDQGHLRVLDSNYSSSYGISRLALRHDATTQINGYNGPPELDEVEDVPIFLLSDEEERQTREVSIDYLPLDHSAVALTAQLPVPSDPQSESGEDAIPAGGDRVEPQRLTRLFWESSKTPRVIVFMAALLLGAAHSLQPGHGKSVVLGASIQGDHPVQQGLLLASSAAGAHLILAVILAVIAVLVFPPQLGNIDGPMTRSVGLFLAILGTWRLGTMLNGLAPKTDSPGTALLSPREAILTGLAIGAIPCWDAVLLLAMAWVVGNLVLGVVLLLAFSLGASATLLGVALCAGWFRRLTPRFRGSSLLQRSLGAAGGLLLATVGMSMFFF